MNGASLSNHKWSPPRRSGGGQRRESMINQILQQNQFVVGERAMILRNGLSTDLMVFPSDLLTKNHGRLGRKIDQAVAYAAGFIDVEQLNALQYLPGSFPPEKSLERWYLTLGLYLYFSDECSRKGSSVSFLTALRETGASLPALTDFEPDQLYQKIVAALRYAGIDSPANIEILDQWKNEGRYSILGASHYWDGTQLHGAYSQLAQSIVQPSSAASHENGRISGINRAISYVIAHKLQSLTGKAPEEMYDLAQKHASNRMLLERLINIGHTKRFQQMEDVVEQAKGQVESDPSLRDTQAQWEPLKREVLSYFPDAALQLLLYSDESIAYADNTNIFSIYPQGVIPGVGAGRSDTPDSLLPFSTAMRFKRYPVALFSNGYHSASDPTELKTMRLAQSSLHELMHIAYEAMTPQEREGLQQQAAKMLNANIPQTGLLKTLDQNNLAGVVRADSTLYNRYHSLDKNPATTAAMRGEEVICNLFGLIHSEFKDWDAATNPIFNGQCKELTEFAQAVEAAFNSSVERLARHAQHASSVMDR